MTKKKIIVLVACILAVVLAVTATVVTLVIVNKRKDTPQLHFENNQLTLEVGQTVALRPVYPKKSSAPVWTSRNEAVATVDDSGNVTAHAIGIAVMKLSVTVGEETQTALCRVTVAERGAEAVGKMVISQSEVSVFAGETYTLSAYLQFGAERFGDVEWATEMRLDLIYELNLLSADTEEIAVFSKILDDYENHKDVIKEDDLLWPGPFKMNRRWPARPSAR